ncbi:MAG: DUF2924 domain-containing protein [Proteobacteria bacterium]|nr:DUF2924 domain-containing protein [Pseudomonadota bacterium]
MAKPSLDLSAEIARLESLAIDALRNEWRRLYQTSPPKRLSRDILLRGITYRLQELAHGGLSKSTVRKLQSSTSDCLFSRRRRRAAAFKAGTRLIREWRGQTHTVVILDDGVEWRGQRYASLSIVAREITGARWSGPRFFGLKTGADDASSSSQVRHPE